MNHGFIGGLFAIIIPVYAGFIAAGFIIMGIEEFIEGFIIIPPAGKY
jgi:hypothetical protein